MAHTKSALKRFKQDEKKRSRNRARKRAVSTYERNLISLVESGKISEAAEALKVCIGAYDKAAKKGVISKEKADRKKSRLTLRVNKAQK